MFRHDFQAGSDGETQHRNKGILESDPVYVVVAGTTDKLACRLVASNEKIKNMRIDSGARRNLLGSTSTFGFGRWFDVVADEPPAEPARCDVPNRKAGTSRQGSRYRWKIHFAGHEQVLETLPNAPRVLTRPPVELEWSEPRRQLSGALIGGIQFRNESHRPRSRWRINPPVHTIQFTGLSRCRYGLFNLCYPRRACPRVQPSPLIAPVGICTTRKELGAGLPWMTTEKRAWDP